jgi:D-alanyl-D-alanine dipeptidase
MDREPIVPETLVKPIPNLSHAREQKVGYREWPIDNSNPLYDEELVDAASFGLAGQSYYSRPNEAADAIEDISPKILIRKSVAEKLTKINDLLDEPTITKLFGCRVELWLEEGLRSVSFQSRLYHEVFPKLIYEQNPGIDEDGMNERRQHLIALPSTDPTKPSPHATGGAADVVLRKKAESKLFVLGTELNFGFDDAETSERANPDYFEYHQPGNDEELEAQRNRRAFYAIMTGSAFGFESGLQVNPTEWWHWSYGDQMWAKLQGEPAALYGAKELSL